MTKIFGDIKVGRRYFVDKNTYHCNNCGSDWDVKMIGTDKCPQCIKQNIITTMHFKTQWTQLWKDAFGKSLN